MSTSPPCKRTRLDENEDNGTKCSTTNRFKLNDNEVIPPTLCANAETYRNSFLTAKPYEHGVISKFCVEGFLDNVIEELKHHSKVKFKESDLFRVYQSIDLGNLDENSPLAGKIPSLMKLKASLYSKEFRSFVEYVANLEPNTLTEQVDCAANCHTSGCHLLCHDDVIGNRKVSFILYLTDPDWCENDGGSLELYESIASSENKPANQDCIAAGRIPKPFPSKNIVPGFNSLAYFVVSPGNSFHSVQEVFCDRPRLSIQGWYHTKDPPSRMEDATLSRLKSSAKGEDTEGPFFPMNSDSVELEKNNLSSSTCSKLSESDRFFLSSYINSTYLTDEAINEIRERFEEESSVQLRHFVKLDTATKVKALCTTLDDQDKLGRGRPSLNYNVGVGKKWKAVGPAHKQRFLEYIGEAGDDFGSTSDVGMLLKSIQKFVFQSPQFGRFLKLLTSLGAPTSYRGRVRRFRPGLDYTVAHYGILTTESVLDATLCFVAGNGFEPSVEDESGELSSESNEDDALWSSGDVGGFECYIAAEDNDEEVDQQADDEYDEEGDSELLSVSACDNTLSLVYRDPGTMRFVKYVGSGAPSSRWDLSLEYAVSDDGTDNESEAAKFDN